VFCVNTESREKYKALSAVEATQIAAGEAEGYNPEQSVAPTARQTCAAPAELDDN
jgi:hypothetical protein